MARRSAKQAIAIGLSEARRAGVDLPPPKKGKAKESTRKSAEYAYEAGQHERKTERRPRVAKAVKEALKREPRSSASHAALSRQAKSAASRRTAADRSAAAKKGSRHQGCRRPLRGGEEGGADPGSPRQIGGEMRRSRRRLGSGSAFAAWRTCSIRR